MASRCRDADVVPKVHDAGSVFLDASGHRVQIMHNGLKVLADGYYGEWMTNLIRLCRGHHEAQEERMFHELIPLLPADATMIELGGFWAFYSLWFLHGAPGRRALVVEPDPAHLDVGVLNAQLNRLSPEFIRGSAGMTLAHDVPFETEESGVLATTCYPVDHLMSSRGIDQLSLLHCDAQGAEVAVLESCRALFAQGRIGWVFVSTHAHQISGDPLTHQRCLAILRECGAVIEAEHDIHESFSGDGLIVARFAPAPPGWRPVELSYNRHGNSLFRHLAYDLADAWQARPLAPDEEPPPDPAPLEAVADIGALLALRNVSPLGNAGDVLLMPRDKEMFPHVHALGSWDIDDVIAVTNRMRAGSSYILLDIGANVGLFTRQLLNRVTNVEQAICVEPDVINFKALQFNLANASTAVRVVNTALGARDGVMQFFKDAENIGNYSLNPDAMRGRTHESISIDVRATAAWMTENVPAEGPIVWKSDTQGHDEVIVSLTPMSVWSRVEVALLEMWRIAKPDYDKFAFRDRLAYFPNRMLGNDEGVSVEAIMTYLDSDDWQFLNLVLWR